MMDDLIRRLSEIRSQYNCFDEAERQYYHALSEAIRELSGRADGDTIYRHAAIEGVKTLQDVAWKNWHEPTLSANVVLDMIRDLPSAQPETDWIPVTKKAHPDKEGKYLVTDDAGGMADSNWDEFIFCDDGTPLWMCSQNVTAWKPFPEPWEEER